MSNEYIPPITEEVAPVSEQPATKPKPTRALPVPEPTFVEPTLATVPDVVGVNKMVNAKGTLVTASMIARIDRHMSYLVGNEGFNDVEERNREQITFIETIGNSMKMDFEGYVVVTDHLLEKIREHQQVFSDGMAFRFTVSLGKDYPADALRNYKGYIELLTKIAVNWKVRYKLKKLIDITYAINDLQPKAKVNVTQYFNKLAAV